jgi:hypothetical protein
MYSIEGVLVSAQGHLFLTGPVLSNGVYSIHPVINQGAFFVAG